uniref:Microsomal glutathione S-transferase 1 n=1 Tax=Neogobius melanostomus TaxID=47308 RepID=A0A8C6V5E2_9GOBI
MASLMEDEVFRSFAKYAAIVIVKMMLMGPWTAYYRMTRKAFANEEDASAHSKKPEDKKRLLRTDEDVERARRYYKYFYHYFYYYNVVPFVLIGLLFALTGPDPFWALVHFRVFVGSRLVHTVAYIWIVGLLTTLSMCHSVIHSAVFH